MPASNFPKIQVFPYFDKLVHLCMYCGLSLLLFWVAQENKNRKKNWIILLIVFGWGLLMEIIQGICHLGRSFEISDAIADLIGFFPALLIWKILLNKTKKIKSILIQTKP